MYYLFGHQKNLGSNWLDYRTIFTVEDDSQAENIATDFGRDWGSEWGEDITRNLGNSSTGKVLRAIWFLKKKMPARALSSMGNIQEDFSFSC